ncbi:hypothetical protein PNOK_0573400 [Pyrrhoderma noxium]|uniref:Uncharacterized protein n=1 Tax=Pyrrhoderma noxium TaxID=2282107 RepID=A0A286UH07_9AGAM|nr:hypothetical protein PNOK_0573400 [Pyrrhoderma noxium]
MDALRALAIIYNQTLQNEIGKEYSRGSAANDKPWHRVHLERSWKILRSQGVNYALLPTQSTNMTAQEVDIGTCSSNDTNIILPLGLLKYSAQPLKILNSITVTASVFRSSVQDHRQ